MGTGRGKDAKDPFSHHPGFGQVPRPSSVLASSVHKRLRYILQKINFYSSPKMAGVLPVVGLERGSRSPTASETVLLSPLHCGSLFIPVPEGILGGILCVNRYFPHPLAFSAATESSGGSSRREAHTHLQGLTVPSDTSERTWLSYHVRAPPHPHVLPAFSMVIMGPVWGTFWASS